MFLVFLITNHSILPQSLEMRVEGKGEFQPNQIITTDNRDANGIVCAGLIIQTDLQGLTFDSNNGIIKTKNDNTGEYFLFLSSTERVVKVFREQYKPLDIILSDFNINLESGKVWKIEITGEKESIPINIVTNPNDVEIFIDGELKGNTPTQHVAIGRHELKIQKAGFKTITDSITVTTQKTLFTYVLEAIKAVVITFKSIPDGATILLNGTDKGRTNRQIFEVPGKYTIKLQKYGYSDLNREIEIQETGNNEFTFELTKNAGYLSLSVNPVDAALFVDGQPKNPGEVEVEAGKHIIELSKQNYITVYDTIDVKLGEKIVKNYELLKNTATVMLALIPNDALIQINGQSVKNTKSIEVPAGSCLLEIKRDGYEGYSETLQLKREEVLEKEIKLTPIYGTLQFSVDPMEATARIIKNDKVISEWTGSVRKDSLLIGTYLIEADCPGYRKSTREFTIKKGVTENLNVTLSLGSLATVKINNIVAESGFLSNANFKEVNDTYIINYDLAGDLNEDYEVDLLLMDSKNSEYKYKLEELTGDAGEGKLTGRDRRIVWNYRNEFSGGLDNDNLYLKLIARKAGGGSSWYYWVGAAVVGGVVAAVLLKPGTTGTAGIPEPPSRP